MNRIWVVFVFGYAVASPLAAAELEDRIDESVRFLQDYLPFQIDLSTRLTQVSRDRQTLVYHYQVRHAAARDVQAHAPALRKRTCANVELIRLLQLGGSVRYTYQMRGTDERVVHEFPSDACSRGGVAL